MAAARQRAQVVIVGGGIVGCSLAYHLTRLGRRDVLVLDQGPLFHNQGSTSHAPGLMFQHNASRAMTRLAMWSVEAYASVRPPGGEAFFQVGSMELATTPARLDELRRRLGQATACGLDAALIGADEARRLVPLLRPDGILGALHVPGDCVVRAAAVAGALAGEAQRAGARLAAHCPVTGIDVSGGGVRAVETPAGRIETETLVLAAGIWGPLLGKLAGVPVPLTPVQHLFAKTTPLAALAGETAEVRHPILRHQDRDLYFRQYGERYGFGSYRHEPLLLEPERIPRDDHPAVLPFTPEHFAASLEDARELLPALRQAGLAERFNGLFSFTPDGFPLLGPFPEVRGLWAAEAVWITHAGGAGRALAEWMVEGSPGLDLRECDVARFQPHATTRPYVRARAARQYAKVYEVVHPRQQAEHPRGLRRSPFWPRQEALRAAFFESAGWERPQWFGSNEALLEGRAPPDWPAREGWAARNWSPVCGAEHRATREGVALFDLTPFAKLEVTGPGALAFLQRLAANRVDRPVGRVVYTPLLNERGGIHCDLTVTRLGDERFLVVTGAATGRRDLAWLRAHLPEDGSVHLSDVGPALCCAGLWGPRARLLLRRTTEDDLSAAAFPFFTARHITVGYVPALALRVSYVGELGWELYAPVEYGLALWDTLWGAGEDLGLVAAGGGAFDSLRLEKGYRLWGQDIHTEHTPYEAGLATAVAMQKGEFIGREALLNSAARGVSRRLVCLTLDDPAVVPMGQEPILEGERVLGYVTSANYGYTVRRSIAYGYVPVPSAAPGTKVEVLYFGRRYPATVVAEPLYDPRGERLRG
jgi:dimethylglycine oxidase